MGRVRVVVKVKRVRDPYIRFVFFALDEKLPDDPRLAKQKYLAGLATNVFEKQYDLDLKNGVHSAEFAVSSPCKEKYFWHGEIYVNDTLLASTDELCYGKPLRIRFTVPFRPYISKLLTVLSGVMGR